MSLQYAVFFPEDFLSEIWACPFPSKVWNLIFIPVQIQQREIMKGTNWISEALIDGEG